MDRVRAFAIYVGQHGFSDNLDGGESLLFYGIGKPISFGGKAPTTNVGYERFTMTTARARRRGAYIRRFHL